MTDQESPSTESLEKRVASLESAVRALTTEVEHLRAGDTPPSETRGSPTLPRALSVSHPMAPRSPLTLPPEARPASWLPSNIDFESLVGRYGTLVLATVSALAAVGLFLKWAMDNGLLGPSQRIALGLTTAVGLAVGGLRLRRRERSFGASLLGLALAITHVCAWGAGPALHLVPPWGAFLLAAAASIALAVFAHAEGDEPLWSVGFTGAAIAPFVTASGRSDLLLLTAYGVAVMASAGYALGARHWIVAARIFLAAALLYTAALATGFERDSGPLLAMGFPLAVAWLGVLPWIDGWRRRDRLRAVGALATLAALRSAMGMNLPFAGRTVATLIAIAGVLWLILVDRTHAVAEPAPQGRRLYEGDWLDAGVLPMGYIVAFVMALDGSARGTGDAFAAGALVLLLTVMRLPGGSLRDAAVFATVLSALLAALFLEKGRPLLLASTIGVLSALCFAANIAWRSVSWPTLGTIGLAWAMLASLGQLAARRAYEYAPFATEPSAVAAVVLLSVFAAWRFARDPKSARLLLGGTIVWAFLWVHQEITFAYNATAAMLFRVTYYAATSVAAVWVGRARHVPLVRHAGLALALLAAGAALYGARHLEAVGARIGADLVAAVFLMAIAYWYRKPGSAREADKPISQ